MLVIWLGHAKPESTTWLWCLTFVVNLFIIFHKNRAQKAKKKTTHTYKFYHSPGYHSKQYPLPKRLQKLWVQAAEHVVLNYSNIVYTHPLPPFSSKSGRQETGKERKIEQQSSLYTGLRSNGPARMPTHHYPVFPKKPLRTVECSGTMIDLHLCFNYIIDAGRAEPNVCLCALSLL